MGTRALAVFQHGDDEHTEIAVLYRQMDGYPDGWGDEIATFLKGGRLVNGISVAKAGTDRIFNGMPDLAAQFIAHFKNEAGSYYLHAAGSRNIGEEYIYTVRPAKGVDEFNPGDGELELTVHAGYSPTDRLIYEGAPSAFDGAKVGKAYSDAREEEWEAEHG